MTKPSTPASRAANLARQTGEIRGLLCPQCNMAIGLAYDSPTVLRNAAGYLEVA